jgi:hypothetical protein
MHVRAMLFICVGFTFHALPLQATEDAPPLSLLYSETDEMLEITWYRDPAALPLTYVRFYFGKKGGRVLPLRFEAQFQGSDWIFARRLLVKVDGRLMVVSPGWTQWHRDNSGSTVWETIDIKAPPALAAALAGATTVEVRFDGEHYSQDYEMEPDEIVALKRVYWIWRSARDPADKRARTLAATHAEELRAQGERERAEQERGRAEQDAKRPEQAKRAADDAMLRETYLPGLQKRREQAKRAGEDAEVDRLIDSTRAVDDPFDESTRSDESKRATRLITLCQSDIVTVMGRVQPQVQACANEFRTVGTAMANISVASGGTVRSATVTGRFADTPTGSCVEAAAKSAKFPACQPMTFPWPFTLSPR